MAINKAPIPVAMIATLNDLNPVVTPATTLLNAPTLEKPLLRTQIQRNAELLISAYGLQGYQELLKATEPSLFDQAIEGPPQFPTGG